jgi:hypothetical protein
MSDYMKEAERLLDEYYLHVSGITSSVCAEEWLEHRTAQHLAAQTRAALLAHIQRGAVPEGWQLVPLRLPMETEMRPVIARLARAAESGQIVLFDDFWSELLAAAPEPDHFRDAAKMMAVQPRVETFDVDFLARLGAEVPAPAEVLGETCADGGKCHHACTDRCFRRECCAPFSDYTGPWSYAPAEVPEPDGTAEANIKPLPGGGYQTGYVDAWSEPLMRTYGAACRAAGEASGYARAANWLRTSAEKHAEENGYHEPDTGSFVFAGRAAEEWNNSVLELADEMEAALRGEVKP